MNRRQKKKLIPADTDYCYRIIGKNPVDGSLTIKRCPHYRVIGEIDDILVDGKGNKYPTKTPVVRCQYMKITSHDDVLLLDSVKSCGERIGYYD